MLTSQAYMTSHGAIAYHDALNLRKRNKTTSFYLFFFGVVLHTDVAESLMLMSTTSAKLTD